MPRYTIALEEQLSLQRTIGSYGTVDMWDVRGQGFTNTNEYTGAIAGLLEIAEPYYVSQQIARMLEDSRHTLPPETTLVDSDFPSLAGFIWIDEPKGWKLRTLSPVGEAYAVKGFLWGHSPEGTMHGHTTVIPVGYTDYSGLGLSLLADQVWTDGDTVGHNKRDQKSRAEMIAKYGKECNYNYKYIKHGKPTEKDVAIGDANNIFDEQGLEMRAMFATLIHFMSQRVTRVSRNGVPRELRRRLPDAYNRKHADPYINVVELRAVDYEREDKPEGEGRDWSTRWIVRGHWRKQWYSSEQRHKPKWIEPYIKGPEGLPVKGASKLFVVKR